MARRGEGVPVLIVDPDEESRRLVIALLDRIGWTPYEASTGPEALALADAARPRVVILEVVLEGISGYEVCRELRDRFGEDIAVMFVSATRLDRLDRIAGLLIGADDYVVKPFDPDELIARLRGLVRRSNGGRASTIPERSNRDPLATLTAREREVLDLLARGQSQSEIAADLVISPNTVATHIQHVLAKLGVHSRAQAVALVHRHGVVHEEVQGHNLVGTIADSTKRPYAATRRPGLTRLTAATNRPALGPMPAADSRSGA